MEYIGAVRFEALAFGDLQAASPFMVVTDRQTRICSQSKFTSSRCRAGSSPLWRRQVQHDLPSLHGSTISRFGLKLLGEGFNDFLVILGAAEKDQG